MTDETPTPESPEPTPEPTPEPAAVETEPVAAVAPPPAPAPAAAPAATTAATATRRRQVAVPVWALTLIAALIGAAVMFGVGYAVGDRGDGRDDEATSQFGPGALPGQGRGGMTPGQGDFGPGRQGRGQLPGGGSQQLPGGGQGGGQGSGSGQTPSSPSSPSTSGAFLGVATQQDADGVKITQIASGSAAEKAGLEVGDVITSFNGRSISTPTALGTAVANLQPGDRVSVEVSRNGARNTVTVTLGSRSTANSN